MAFDKIHVDVRKALEKEGWHISKEPFQIKIAPRTTIFADMGAERFFVADRGVEKILVEVKSLTGGSIIYPFYTAFGQYVSYRDALSDEGIFDREVYLATGEGAFIRMSNNPFILKQIERYRIKLIIVDIERQIILQWKK